MLTNEQKKIMSDHVDMLCKQLDKMNKKGDITPDELKRSSDVFDIVKDYEVICAMEDYGHDPEEEMYSSMGYYGRNSRTAAPYVHDPAGKMPMYSAQGRDSMGRYSSAMGNGYSQGYSRDDGKAKTRRDLEMKLANATDERERNAIMTCLEALNN
jgi:hypothetical protein